MENTGQIVRSRKTGKSRYTPINNDILQSKTLTPEEKSILVHLLSLPEDWVTYKTVIWEDMNIGRDRFNKHWKGLVDKGYIVSIKFIKPNGQFAGYNHVVYEQPVLPINQVTENQDTVIQSTDNQVTEIQLTGVQLTGVQCVNKVITTQSNKLESNNIIPKEDIAKEEKFNSWKEVDEYLKHNNLEFTTKGMDAKGLFNDYQPFIKGNIEKQIQIIKNNTKQLQLN